MTADSVTEVLVGMALDMIAVIDFDWSWYVN